jgi:O-glycosyl hydrolase
MRHFQANAVKLGIALFKQTLTLATLLVVAGASAQTVTVDASMSNQTLEGWGTSLAWFANGVGGWTNTTNYNNLMSALFDPSAGLGLNYLRYNIGGGDDPLCGTSGHYACISSAKNAVPGYEPSPGTYDWTADANQRNVATSAKSLGADLFEAISYSPPYWMTVSGTSQGAADGGSNLASSYYGSGTGTFVDYLTTVASHFSSNWGITFHHLDPVNEPGEAWWLAGDAKQEGCGFLALSDQETIIQNLAASLSAKGMTTTLIAAMDENREGTLNTYSYPVPTSWEFYNYDATTQGDVDSLNTHGYSSTVGSVALATTAQHTGQRVTMSEWGSSDTTGQDLSNQIIADMYLTRPVAWSIWQPDWPGLMSIDYINQNYTLNEAYYVYGNFSKFIRPGFQFLAISDPQSLAAFNQQTKTLVIVTQNWSSSSRAVNYQLSHFASTGSSAEIYQTDATEQLADLGSISVSGGAFGNTVPANSVTTYVIQNTSYTPTATSVNDNTTGTGLNQFNYHGTWGYVSQTGAYDNDNHWSSVANDYYTFKFSGQQVRVYASMETNGGILAFSVDNGAETYFDSYAPARQDNVFLFATPTLGNGTHTLKVRNTGLKNAASSGHAVPADRIDVVGNGSEVGQDIYKIVNVSNGLDLEVNGASLANGGSVGTYADVAGANNEHWNLLAVGDGSYRIVNVESGLDLEVKGASTANGGTVDQWEDSGWKHEHWNLVSVSGGYRIVNANSGLDLEVNGTTGKVDQWTDVSGATNEHWTLTITN